MQKTNKNPQSELETLQNLVSDLQKTILEKDSKISELQHQLHLFRHAKFGRKSEKVSNDQMALTFDESHQAEEKPEATNEQETITYTRSKKTGRKPLPKHLPYIENVYDLSDTEKQCDCGCEMKHIGDDISEQLDVVPQMTFRVINIKKKYVCNACDESIKVAKAPKQVIPGSIATPGLLSGVIDAKFNRHMPLYRQEAMFQSIGATVTRATLSQWLIKSATLLEPLVKLMHQQIIDYDIAYADETKLQVLKEKNRKATTLSYMWLFIGGPPDKRCTLYQYHPTRAESVAFNFFEDFRGYIHADCYQAYINLGKKKDIQHVACLTHARRYFMDIVKTSKKKKGLAYSAVTQLAELYRIEKELKENNASPDEIYEARQNKSKPILDDFKFWLDENIARVPPKSPIGKAINYSLKHWASLIRYIDDGRLEIDNNRSERAIKPFVIGRRNWLFHGSKEGAHAGSILYSIIETCKTHNVDVFAYLKYAITNVIHCNTCEDLEKLLPYNCSKSCLDHQRDIQHLIFPEKNGAD